MPTGYTAAVGEGKITTLRQFALQCARGMGACIMMRDDPWDAPIPERFEPNTGYHDKGLAAAQKLLDELPLLTDDECINRADEDYDARFASYQKYEDERKAENGRYRDMLAAVRGWDTEAEGIKDFMVDQLRISIRDFSENPPKRLSGEEWRATVIASAIRDVNYHTEERVKEIQRTEGRNQWVAALRISLPEI